MTRWPPGQVVPFGSQWMARCAECGEIAQHDNKICARDAVRDHQRWTHPTDDERSQDALRTFETLYMDGYCERCGHQGHQGKDCPTVTPDLLRGAS